MTHDSSLCTSSQKWIKTRMKTLKHLNNNGNEVIICCYFEGWSCFHEQSSSLHVLSSLMLVALYLCKRVNNDNVHQNLRTVFNDKDIHSSLGVVREKVGYLPLNMCSILQSNSCDNILKCTWAIIHSFPHGHWSKWVPRSSMVWPHWHHERWAIVGCGKPKQVCI
jgi:hypothetical protein